MGIRAGALGAGLVVVSLLSVGCTDRTRTVDPRETQEPGSPDGSEVPSDVPPVPSEDGGTPPDPTPDEDGGTPPDAGEPEPEEPEPPEAGPWPVDAVLDYTQSFGVGKPQSVGLDEGLNLWLLEGYRKGAMLRTSIITDPSDGRIPPLNAEGQKRAQDRAAARKGIGPFDSAQARGLSERCIYWAHEGPPLLPTGYNSNLQIVQAPGTFVIQPEMMPVARVVPLDARPALASAIKAYRGDWRGHWEGDTMVIVTTNYSEKTAWRGSSPSLKVTERLTMTSPTKIRYQFTVEDAATWTRPWSGEYEMTRIEGPLFEYACHEGNYQLPSILKGARRAEATGAK